jgi:hypothetical protein
MAERGGFSSGRRAQQLGNPVRRQRGASCGSGDHGPVERRTHSRCALVMSVAGRLLYGAFGLASGNWREVGCSTKMSGYATYRDLTDFFDAIQKLIERFAHRFKIAPIVVVAHNGTLLGFVASQRNVIAVTESIGRKREIRGLFHVRPNPIQRLNVGRQEIGDMVGYSVCVAD